MKPRIETFPGKKLAGKRMKMSVEENRTAELWRSFMPERKNIRNSIGTDLYSVQLYDPGYFDTYNPGGNSKSGLSRKFPVPVTYLKGWNRW